MYKIYEIGNFEKDLKKLLDTLELKEYEIFKEELKKGKILGKPLGYDFFREKKNWWEKNLFFSLQRNNFNFIY